MRLVIQRTKEATLTVDEQVVGHIDQGFFILVGIEERDTDEDIEWLCQKIVKMRVFPDAAGVPNLSIQEVPGADILLVSQFTLMASSKKGNRPSYIHAARPEISEPMYQKMVLRLAQLLGHPIQTGIFGADMQIDAHCDGPHTILMDSQNRDIF